MFGIYIHWPFCASKCPYCDFNSHVTDSIDIAAWRNAYLNEINEIARITPGRTITSIFFGGGTPSLMPPKLAGDIISAVAKHWDLAENVEITLEANPTSVEQKKFASFHDAGVNRVSLGVQSLRDDALKFLGRQHDVSEAKKALEIAYATFNRVSFDLIYARPDQTAIDWEHELLEAIDLAQAGHLSLYQLTIEPGTAFHTMYQRREFEIPDDNLGGELYEFTQSLTSAHSMKAYEISNYAIHGEESLHNLTYWRYADYAGVGPGAHGRLTIDNKKLATRTHRAPEIWLNNATQKGHAYHPFEELNPDIRALECILMGLRLAEGLPVSRIEKEGSAPWTNFLDHQRVQQMIHDKLMTETAGRLCVTPAGMQRLEAILREVIV